MAVLITNMNMPKDCSDCIFTMSLKRDYCILIHAPAVSVKDAGMCPLKSVEEITETPIEEFIKRFRVNAEHQRKIGDLHGCLEFRQLADTLEKYQKIEQIVKEWGNSGLIQNQLYDLIKGVLEDGNYDN